MIKSYVIELDTEDDFVRVLEVNRTFRAQVGDRCQDCTSHVNYHRKPDARESIANFGVNPRFFGKLDALLVTKAKIDAAQPIEPEKEHA